MSEKKGGNRIREAIQERSEEVEDEKRLLNPIPIVNNNND